MVRNIYTVKIFNSQRDSQTCFGFTIPQAALPSSLERTNTIQFLGFTLFFHLFSNYVKDQKLKKITKKFPKVWILHQNYFVQNIRLKPQDKGLYAVAFKLHYIDYKIHRTKPQSVCASPLSPGKIKEVFPEGARHFINPAELFQALITNTICCIIKAAMPQRIVL